MPITADIQGLEPGSIVDLYEVDATALGAEIYRYHPHKTGGIITFQGLEYTPWPMEASGFEMTGTSKQPIPSLTMGNVNGFISSLCIFFHDLVGAKLTRRRTLSKYLDGMPEADPTEEFSPDVWYVERKASENSTRVQFELSSALDFGGQQLPRGQIIANTCRWLTIGGYRGPYCGYNGPPVATEFDVITTDAEKDKCGGLVKSCKLRFGEEAELPYGSFPSAGLIR